MDSNTASPLVNITFCSSCLIYRHVLPHGNVHCLSRRSTQTAEREHPLQCRVNLSGLPALIQLFHQLPEPPLWLKPYGSWLFLTEHPQVTQNVTALAFHHGWPYENTFKSCKLTSVGLSEHMEARLSVVFLPIYHCCSELSGFTVVFCTLL